MKLESYEKNKFLKFFKMVSLIYKVIEEDNVYKHELEDIFYKDNDIEFLANSFLYNLIPLCSEDNDDNINWDHVKHAIIIWWEGVDDKLYNARLNNGEKI